MKKEIKAAELNCNPCHLIGKDWMLITAGNEEKCNTMTAAWGGLGYLWNKDVAFIFVRPQRYTKDFVDREDTFSLSFFSEDWRKELAYLGKVSGRDEDKIAKSGLTVEFIENTPCFKEARLTVVCRKMYRQSLTEDCFIDKDVMNRNYPEKDWHDVYVGEIIKVLVEE
ncbi:MAG: flavin reductase [Clostridia bacterium]|nr:flavin reductase [Clostridia bacterium]